MRSFRLLKQISLSLIFLVCFIFCNGQINLNSASDSASQLKTFAAAQSKIPKPAGTHKDDNIRCAIQDKNGNLWFGTSGGGVYMYDGKLFTNFTVTDGLSNNFVWSILEDKNGKIWFGTDSGLCQYDASAAQTSEKKFIPVPMVVTHKSNPLVFSSPTISSSVNNGVWSMLQDKSGKIWLGTVDGLYCYDGKKFSYFLDNEGIINNSGLHLKRIACITEDKNGNMWFASGMGGFEGICRYDGEYLTSFKPGGNGWIRSMMEDKNGNLWFGTRSNGLWRYDGKDYSNFTEKEGFGKNITSVTALTEDKSGNIWFGVESTIMAGVWYYDGKSFKSFTTKDGLVNNSVWCIIEDRDKNIWVGSRNNGLSRYNFLSMQADGKSFTSFTE